MTEPEPVEVTNLDRYGDAELPWSRPRDLLAGGPAGVAIGYFLGTARPGGRPHAAGVEGEAFTAPFSAPSAGPPPWELHRFRFHIAVGVATAEPYGATRWRFG